MRQKGKVGGSRTIIAGGLVVLVSLTAACGSVMHRAGHRTLIETRHVVPENGHTRTHSAVIKFGDGMILTPAPRDARPKLTAQEAWANYTKVNTSYTTPAIPRNVSVHLGLLMEPAGPNGPGGSETYLARNDLWV
jgi:hypothetical protein